MKYKCKAIPVDKLLATGKGFIKPLCDNCETLDCDNDIEIKKISILGITTEMRLLTKKDDSYMVVACDGHLINDRTKKSNN